MANNWNIPAWLEKEVRERDTVCVYCGDEFTPAKVSKKSAASLIACFVKYSIVIY